MLNFLINIWKGKGKENEMEKNEKEREEREEAILTKLSIVRGDYKSRNADRQPIGYAFSYGRARYAPSSPCASCTYTHTRACVHSQGMRREFSLRAIRIFHRCVSVASPLTRKELFTHNNSPGDQPPARDGYCDHAALWEYAPDYRRDLRAFKRGKAVAFFRYVLNFYSFRLTTDLALKKIFTLEVRGCCLKLFPR